MLPNLVLKIIAMFNASVARELTDNGLVREKTVVTLKL